MNSTRWGFPGAGTPVASSSWTRRGRDGDATGGGGEGRSAGYQGAQRGGTSGRCYRNVQREFAQYWNAATNGIEHAFTTFGSAPPTVAKTYSAAAMSPMPTSPTVT